MIGLLKIALGWVRSERSYVTLLLIAAAAASLYVWGALGRADRARLISWGETVCAAAGAKLDPAEGRRGAACLDRVAALAREERDTAAESARILAQAAADREAKAAQDAALARAAAADARAAAETMEKVNAQVGSDDRVSGNWFGALNRAGGLRAPGG